jgi:hypothetical protein
LNWFSFWSTDFGKPSGEKGKKGQDGKPTIFFVLTHESCQTNTKRNKTKGKAKNPCGMDASKQSNGAASR